MKINIGVFFGGRSVEHEVSIISALQAIHAIDSNKYNVIPVYISKEGIFYTGEALLEIQNYEDMKTLLSRAKRISIVKDLKETLIFEYPPGIFRNTALHRLDLAIPVVHGTNVEDGTLQGYLESIDIPYAGPDVLSSAIGMDKIIFKKVLKESGLPVLDYVWFYTKDWLKDSEAIYKKVEAQLKYPLIVKPANLGSSVGITPANNRTELEEAIELAGNFSKKILIEEMIVNLREINCSVLGDYEKTRASVCEEPVSSVDILSYQDKYMGNSGKGMGGSLRRLPADIPAEMSNLIQDLAVKTFQTLGCDGVSRIDFLIETEKNEVYVNEINTIPGSLSFYLWEASGLSFSDLMEELIQLALKKQREREQLIFSYETNILSMHSKGSKGPKS